MHFRKEAWLPLLILGPDSHHFTQLEFIFEVDPPIVAPKVSVHLDVATHPIEILLDLESEHPFVEDIVRNEELIPDQLLFH